ncbi:hypothetical protein CapIbe_014444 [Capra ibex]
MAAPWDQGSRAVPLRSLAACADRCCRWTPPLFDHNKGRILTQDPKALVALQPLWALTLPLECLGGFDFCHCDLQIQETHLWKRELLPQDHRRRPPEQQLCRETSQGRVDTPGPAVLASWEAPV